MMRLFFLAAIVFADSFVFGQQTQAPNKVVGYEQLTSLKKGALIVRLKTDDRSVAAYRQAGQNQIADRIVQDRQTQNLKIADAFRSQFDFCKVYFIYTKNTDKILQHQPGYFLNDTLAADTSIKLKENFYLFAEYGTVNANMRTDEYHYSGVNKTTESSNPASSSALFMSDTTLTQLKEPFPFYTVVLLDNYRQAVERWNNALYRVYYRWTVKQQYNPDKKKKSKR